MHGTACDASELPRLIDLVLVTNGDSPPDEPGNDTSSVGSYARAHADGVVREGGIMRVSFVVWMLASLACSSDGGQAVSCTTPASGPKALCSEVDNPPQGSGSDQVRQSCQTNNGSFANAPCDRTGALGGCLLAIQGATFSTTTWYYPSGSVRTQADVMAACTGMQATFVTP